MNLAKWNPIKELEEVSKRLNRFNEFTKGA